MEISEGSGQTRVKSFFLHISVNTKPFSNARLCRDSTQTDSRGENNISHAVSAGENCDETRLDFL